MNTRRRFVLFDGRAADGNTERAACFCFEDTMPEAVLSARGFGEACIFSFIEKPTGENERGEQTFDMEDLRLVKVIRA